MGSAPTRADERHSFEAGQLLAGRFRIVRFIASGGMGEVYEAEDQVLRERVALKTIRSDAGDERDTERFRREIQLARKVTHPNVCRIYDVFHHVEEGSDRSVAFLSMELLEGETLAQHLAGHARLPAAEALPLLRQMAAALDAAHARGVVHRDFKPGNVMLVPSPPGGQPRVAVTDFGLALAQGPGSEDTGASASLVGRIVGTPAYMAPEQVKALRVGPAADVYAFGVVAYEMVAGRPPSWARTLFPPPRCGSRGRPRRPRASRRGSTDAGSGPSCAASSATPRPGSSAPGTSAGRSTSRAGRSAGARGGLARAGRAGAGRGLVPGAWAGRAPHAGGHCRRPPASRGGGARLPQPGGPARAGLARDRLVGDALVRAHGRRPAAPHPRRERRADPGRPGSRRRGQPGRRHARRLRGALAVDMVVVGSYFASGAASGGRVRLDVRVQDARTGETVHSLIENGTEAELPVLVSRCGQQLRAALGGGAPAPEDGSLQAGFGQDPQATRLYSEGLALLRQHEAGAARDKLLEATRADPRHALAQSALAEAWARLGYQERARAAAQKALELAVGLPREQRLQVEARRHEHSFDWPAAARTYRTLFDFFPDSVEYGLKLAECLSRDGKGHDALGVVTGLRRLAAPEGEDPRIDLAEARAARALSEPARSERAAREAARKAGAARARLVAADALLEQSWALFLQGQGAGAKQSAAGAQALFDEAGDRNGSADAAQLTAHVLWMQEGDFAGAVRVYEQALSAYRASGNRRGVAQALVNLAGPRAEQGELGEARRLCEEALPIFVEIAAREEQAAVLVNLSSLALQAGDLPQARARAAEALALARQVSSRSAEAHALENTGLVELVEGRLAAARDTLGRAAALRREIGESVNAASAELLAARADLEEGRLVPAAEVARRLAGEMAAAQQPEAEAAARSLLARASLQAGRVDEAEAAAAAAEKLAPGLGRHGRLEVELAAALVLAGRDRAGAIARLREVARSAQASGPLAVALDARRSLAALGAEDPQALAREARQRRALALFARPAGGPAPPRPNRASTSLFRLCAGRRSGRTSPCCCA